jgi:hypothetical protein
MGNSKTTQELFNELTNRLIIPLEDNEIQCPTCKGLRFVYKQQNEKGYIENCTDCYNGKLYACKHCGTTNKTDHCNCKEAQKERDNEFNQVQFKKEQELFDKAEKIQFNDYTGYFIINEGHVDDAGAVYDWMYDKIKYEKLSDNDLPKYLWSTEAEPVFSLNIKDIIDEKCEDGYEDMSSRLDTDDGDLEKAQEFLDKWYSKQGDSVNIYYENHSVAVLLDDLIKEIKENIEKEDVK